MLILPHVHAMSARKKKKKHENLTELSWYSLPTNFNINMLSDFSYEGSSVQLEMLSSEETYSNKLEIQVSTPKTQSNYCKGMNINNRVKE